MIIYLQNREYIKGIEQGRGMRLYVHPFGTQPFVADSGISIPTGFQTYIGMRQVCRSAFYLSFFIYGHSSNIFWMQYKN